MWRDIFVVMAQLLVAPHVGWREIKKERKTTHDFLYRYLHPVFGVIALASFVGGLWIVRDGNLEFALKRSIVSVVAVYGGYFLASYILNETAVHFGIEKNVSRLRKFVGFASVVVYLLYLLTPFLNNFLIIWLLALYTVHVANTGATLYLQVPEEKKISFSLLASALIVFIPLAIQLLFSTLMN
ncbi:MAG: DUF1282 family protein [Bacteroidales bacterium]|nr:DUF1282 family protein [Bacteroidales bacterium]